MLWKIFAIISALLFASGVVSYDSKDWIDVAAIPVELIAVAGLVIYAFDIAFARSRSWLGFAWFYAAFSIFEVGVGATRSVVQGLSAPAIIGGTIVAAAYLSINWLALHRLGKLPRPLSGVA